MKNRKKPANEVSLQTVSQPLEPLSLCLYDGFKLRSYNEDYIQWMTSKEQLKFFKFDATYNATTGDPKIYNGRYENLEIEIRYNPDRRWSVDISGSVHKFSNQGKHNYNDFYWKDFLAVYAKLIAVFRFDPEEIEVVNLEVGVNCELPDYIQYTIADIIESILSLYGKCNSKSRALKSKRDSYSVDKGERYLKMYYKSLQYQVTREIMRMELGYERARQIETQLGIKRFSCLTKPSTVARCKETLIKAFETIHLSQPDLLSKLPINEIESNKEILNYSSPGYWCKLKKASRTKYNKALKDKEPLVNKYCSDSLSGNIIRMLVEKLR